MTPLSTIDAGRIQAGDRLEINVATGVVKNLTRRLSYACEPVPPALREMLDAGGLLPLLTKKLAAGKAVTKYNIPTSSPRIT